MRSLALSLLTFLPALAAAEEPAATATTASASPEPEVIEPEAEAPEEPAAAPEASATPEPSEAPLPSEAPAPEASATPSPRDPRPNARGKRPTPTPGKPTTEIKVSAFPVTAKISIGDVEIENGGKVVLHGEPVTVRISAEGYVEQRVVLKPGPKKEIAIVLRPKK